MYTFWAGWTMKTSFPNVVQDNKTDWGIRKDLIHFNDKIAFMTQVTTARILVCFDAQRGSNHGNIFKVDNFRDNAVCPYKTRKYIYGHWTLNKSIPGPGPTAAAAVRHMHSLWWLLEWYTEHISQGHTFLYSMINVSLFIGWTLTNMN